MFLYYIFEVQNVDYLFLQITEKRTKLPIASFRDAITSAIDSHQVFVNQALH